jgi:hypothetical protein
MAGRKKGLGSTAFLFPFYLGGPQATHQDSYPQLSPQSKFNLRKK